ncbi:uncharacterized protein L3040_001710 [Drepanopeziza brunnea f. sp. 'multigermtubi']|uniref:uncharacterized protein n=1 Tax=Drepanopeziza brunnea f. sp. 'multigermtubi' TaxID=698441 RepID=UPI00239CDD06|nr:hypothetical protein L3040_001710 [Drepanopeziza brunnea f. sp. 'multigermtubi']
MPKKRFTSQYSKPPSTVHPSLNSHSHAASSSSSHNDAKPTVNDLISSSRKLNVSPSGPAPATVTTPTLPPQIRSLLSQPETPVPHARNRRRLDANGRRIPPGPAPPRSWLEGSRYSYGSGRSLTRVLPTDVRHLPGLPDEERKGATLQDMCLREMARQWEFVRDYEMNNLVDVPGGLRMKLLSYLAVYGPDEGVGFEGLKSLFIPPSYEDGSSDVDPGEHNEGIFRLDLSGAMGNSISFKQLVELVQMPEPQAEADSVELSWEDTSLSKPLSATLPMLTHLSLSHPASTVSWPRLLSFAKHVPNLTQLSLAYWPVPSLTPNAKNTVVQSTHGQDIQYGGTNYYSHSLDNDFREAADVLRRLADRLPGLQYLDLTGCTDWLQALRWTGDINDRSIAWGNQWIKLRTLKIHSGLHLSAESEYSEVTRFVMAYRETLITEQMIRFSIRRTKSSCSMRTVNWIDVQKDDWKVYADLWPAVGATTDEARKRIALMALDSKDFVVDNQWTRPFDLDPNLEREPGVVERMSVWDS